MFLSHSQTLFKKIELIRESALDSWVFLEGNASMRAQAVKDPEPLIQRHLLLGPCQFSLHHSLYSVDAPAAPCDATVRYKAVVLKLPGIKFQLHIITTGVTLGNAIPLNQL